MPNNPRIPPHSLSQVGDTVVLCFDDERLKNIPLCTGRLKPRTRASDDHTVNILYVVGTANREKMSDMHRNMENMIARFQERAKPNVSINLDFHGLDVSSGQESQPIGFQRGMAGAAGKTGRAGNAFLATCDVVNKDTPPCKISGQEEEALRSKLARADLHIFGGQEASPNLDVEPPYEPNYIAYYCATEFESPMEQSRRYLMAETPGLEVSAEAVREAVERNKENYGGSSDWTGGKVLVEWGWAESHSNWHRELGPKGKDRFSYPTQGYEKLDLPWEWFEDVFKKSRALSEP
jgi:hypothetical protein